ncbi:hypothetical protein [Bythopirellula goksoeyrii]|uniref:Carboxypeptidase regulatory-like domain-containing protein n=1 Tax=Bythopirellula goksoeyrii TaxID=1400387 RepID=A0A5B9Q6T7_9BACT|nr:hypothetical protein [Bythopirellula goksoeyrii]QEG33429.1 hypothetical protein Pr1d_06920 [Bythopirellula goksoeyrii]
MQKTPINSCINFAIVFLCVAGCGKSKESEATSVVTGNVSYQGQPLSKGSVLYQHSSGKTAVSDIKEDGNYRLDATPGSHKVAIISREPDKENPEGRPRIIPGKDLIPAAYGEFRTSGLTATVDTGEDQINFELRDSSTK